MKPITGWLRGVLLKIKLWASRGIYIWSPREKLEVETGIWDWMRLLGERI